ncbi:MAG TPA: TolC family protein [Bryobacteraceae bacterium]|nr:TolC family protein [Bryobacteraceae bacterium]
MTPPVFGQETPSVTEEMEGGSWHSRFTRRYTARALEPQNYGNSTRLDALIRAGRIYLGLQDAIALALENNLDIEIQRYGPRIAQADLLRAQAGGLIRGLSNAGAQQGPQSALNQLTGGAGTGTGNSNFFPSSSGGGAGAGTIITSTGTQIPNLDEVLNVQYNWAHRSNPNSNTFSTGIPNSVFQTNNFSASVTRGFLLGTTMNLGFATQDITSNNIRSEINPVKTGNVQFQVTQRLLQGFGIAVNNRNIRIARNDVKVADLVFKQQVIQTVSTVINLYSDMVSFGEDVKVRRQALALNEKLYNDNRKQVEIGTLAPIEIVRAEAEVARSQQELTQAETQLLQQETILKNYITRSGVLSPLVMDARIVATDRLEIPSVEPVRPIQDLVELAIGNRPELTQTTLNLENARIQLEGSKSQLLPSLDLVAGATNNGLAGQVNGIPVPQDLLQQGFLRRANPSYLGGYGLLFGQLFRRNYPDYNVGFTLNVPLRNRSAQADVVRDQLNIRQSELRQRRELNQITVDVQNAVIGLQQSRARYQSAQKSRVLQEQTLDAEQKKYALGASTIFFVIQAQRDLAQAQAAEVTALSAYNRARVNLDTATGQLLENHNVSLEEAFKGQISRAPSPVVVNDSRP